MKLKQIAVPKGGDCGGGRCPTVYETDRGTLLVQGFRVKREELGDLSIPAGEDAVEIPVDLITEAALTLRS